MSVNTNASSYNPEDSGDLRREYAPRTAPPNVTNNTRAASPVSSAPANNPPSAPSRTDVHVGAYSASGSTSIMAEVVRAALGNESDLLSVGAAMKKLNDRMSALRFFENVLRKVSSDEFIDQEDIKALRKAMEEAGIKEGFEGAIKQLDDARIAAGGTLSFKPYSSDENIKGQSKSVEQLLELVSNEKDGANGAISAEQTRLQVMMNRKQQLEALRSNVLSIEHQVQMAIVNNIRGS